MFTIKITKSLIKKFCECKRILNIRNTYFVVNFSFNWELFLKIKKRVFKLILKENSTWSAWRKFFKISYRIWECYMIAWCLRQSIFLMKDKTTEGKFFLLTNEIQLFVERKNLVDWPTSTKYKGIKLLLKFVEESEVII